MWHLEHTSFCKSSTSGARIAPMEYFVMYFRLTIANSWIELTFDVMYFGKLLREK